MGARGPRPAVLDTGALIALGRGDRSLARLLELADEIHVPAGVFAQAWRDPTRQVRLVRLMAAEEVTVHPLDENVARQAGRLCGRTGTADVIDASVVLLARRFDARAVTSDPDDLRLLDPGIELVAC